MFYCWKDGKDLNFEQDANLRDIDFSPNDTSAKSESEKSDHEVKERGEKARPKAKRGMFKLVRKRMEQDANLKDIDFSKKEELAKEQKEENIELTKDEKCEESIPLSLLGFFCGKKSMLSPKIM